MELLMIIYPGFVNVTPYIGDTLDASAVLLQVLLSFFPPTLSEPVVFLSQCQVIFAKSSPYTSEWLELNVCRNNAAFDQHALIKQVKTR